MDITISRILADLQTEADRYGEESRVAKEAACRNWELEAGHMREAYLNAAHIVRRHAMGWEDYANHGHNADPMPF